MARPVRLGAALLLLAGAAVYQRLDKDLTLVVDGRERPVSTMASSVSALLDGQDVAVGPHDRVRPEPGTALADGMRVEVQHAKEISLVLNGTPQTLHVVGQTVEDVLEHVNVRAGRNAYLRPSRGAPIEDGDVVEVRQAISVRVRVGGETKRVITNAPDVGYLLDSFGIVVRRHDRVEPALDAPLTAGATVAVTRVTFRKVVERRDLAYGTQTRPSDSLLKGVTRVQRPGRTGLLARVFRVRSEDGTEVDRELLREKRIREPQDEIVLVGTREPNEQTGTASWYHRTGMVAAHKTLPKGTRVRVTNLSNGKQVTVVIDDRGPFVNGWIIDLSDDAFAQLAPLGTGILKVRIEW